jgi:hypothetical protein
VQRVNAQFTWRKVARSLAGLYESLASRSAEAA